MFHHYYYDAVARVKCSLSRSDSDSNWFLTGWWFIPHTNHASPSGSLRSPMTLSKKPRDNNHGPHYPRTARLPGRTLGSLFASLLHPLQHQSANLSLSRLGIVSLASRSKGTLLLLISHKSVRHFDASKIHQTLFITFNFSKRITFYFLFKLGLHINTYFCCR
jgi:hypothetical protein